MSYAFDKINSLLGDQENKVDIFNQGSSGRDGGNYDPTQTSGRSLETDTSGDIGSNPGGQANTNAAPANAASLSSKAAFNANMGKTDTPKSVTNASNTLDQQQTDLQNKANDYVKAGTIDYSVDDPTLKNAYSATGDDQKNAYSKVGNVLNTVVSTAAGAFEAPKVGVEAVDYLKNEAGINRLVSQGQDLNYTPGMASFDTAVLQGNPEFQNIRNLLQTKQTGLQNQATKHANELPGQVNTTNNTNLSTSQKSVKDRLAEALGLLSTQNQSEADQANSLMTANKASAQASALSRAQQAATDNLDPQAANYVYGANFDFSPYEKSRNAYTSNDFISGDDAYQFNNINGLLGKEDMWTQSQAYDPSQDYQFDEAGMTSQQMRGAENSWAPVKQGYEQDISSILGAAGERAKNGIPVDPNFGDQQFNQILSTLDPEQQQMWKDMIAQQQGNIGGPSDFGVPDSSQFIQAHAPYSATDMLSQQEADKLNMSSKALGRTDQYSAGNPADYTYDSQGAKSAIQGLLDNGPKKVKLQAIDKEIADLQSESSKQIDEIDMRTGDVGPERSKRAIWVQERLKQLQRDRAKYQPNVQV